MLIKWTRNNLHAFGTPDGKSIHNLRPGWNEFPSYVWKQYENHPDVKRMIEAKEIELMDLTVKQGKKTVKLGTDDKELHLKDVDNEAKAIEIVKATYNRDMLQRWSDEETRHKVKRAVDAQLKPLLPESQTATA